jgi:hypothetical protein
MKHTLILCLDLGLISKISHKKVPKYEKYLKSKTLLVPSISDAGYLCPCHRLILGIK